MPASCSVVISVPAISTVPVVGLSRPARMCISVDLPEPDGPMTAVSLPASMSSETPRSASTAVSPSPKRRLTSLALTTAAAAAAAAVTVRHYPARRRLAIRVTPESPRSRPRLERHAGTRAARDAACPATARLGLLSGMPGASVPRGRGRPASRPGSSRLACRRRACGRLGPEDSRSRVTPVRSLQLASAPWAAGRHPHPGGGVPVHGGCARRSRSGGDACELRDDLPPVRLEHLFLAVRHQVDVELVDADRLELTQLLRALLGA